MKENQYSAQVKTYLAVIIIVSWFALITQFVLNALLKASSTPEMIVRYFSYFTIQTNILVAVCYTTLLFGRNAAWGSFFSKQQTLAAITVYIVIVGLVYNIVLRSTWNPSGLQKLIDELLHTFIPLLVLFYWLLFVQKNQLQWRNVFLWLLYPFAYILYVLIRGSVAGFYPYPFINTNQLGINKVLVNSVAIAVVFIFISLIAIAIGKAMNKKMI